MRLTVCLEGNAEGRVLASVDMEEIVKMTITDDIEKSNFNPQMLKSCTDTSYQCGYEQGRADAIDEFVKFANTMPTVEEDDGEIRPMWLEEMAEKLKEQNNG